MENIKIKIWAEDDIARLIQNNEKVLYSSLKHLYDCQTDAEKSVGNTQEHNGVGFSAYDAPFLSAMVKSLEKWGHLTNGQKEKTIPILVKYRKQITKLANEYEAKKYERKTNNGKLQKEATNI